MKATGIVRRIDDLGRVVIPKEIRRTMRIREGDPLEIFTDRQGEIILKKYSPMGEVSEVAKEYAESISRTLGHTALIYDRDGCIAAAGPNKKEYQDKRISAEIEDLMQKRHAYAADRRNGRQPYPLVYGEEDGETYWAQVVVPIIAEGEASGAVALVSKKSDATFGEAELKTAQTAASFLARQLN